MDIWGRGQMVADPCADNFRVYEFLKQARMGFNGAVPVQHRRRPAAPGNQRPVARAGGRAGGDFCIIAQ
ncbi:MAG: hypothetical protein KGL74_14255 [Elusimicrobia bacterium]|nr:hypothetical protein [Elusimicrobiota bacterium]MDE2512283.1 hypothetical protein [Elusimicrobiota bacterium]